MSLFRRAIDYREFVCTIKPRSSFRTPLQADTLWAALMWMHAYRHGDQQKTHELVHADPPLLLLSDGFPYGYLPKPKNFIPIDRVNDIVEAEYGSDWEKRLMGIDIAKRFAAQDLLPAELVNRLVSGESEEAILRELLRVEWCPKRFIKTSQHVPTTPEYAELRGWIHDYCNPQQCDAVTTSVDSDLTRRSRRHCAQILGSEPLKRFGLVKSERVRKNRIDRVMMRALAENGLFSQEEDYLLHNSWWVFVRVHPDWSDELRELFDDLSNYGYGRRKSAGKGQFRACLVKPSEISAQQPKNHNEPDGFITLSSSYVPTPDEFQEDHCRYTFHIKRGKVDGHIAASGRFMKKPIVMYEAGSVFRTDRLLPYYGKLVEGVYESVPTRSEQIESIVQYGYAFPLYGKFFSR